MRWKNIEWGNHSFAYKYYYYKDVHKDRKRRIEIYPESDHYYNVEACFRGFRSNDMIDEFV